VQAGKTVKVARSFLIWPSAERRSDGRSAAAQRGL
jgi:hypothetical protein